jgi:PAS domain S-box-containing protein
MDYHRLREGSPYLVMTLGAALFLIAVVHHTTELYAINDIVGPLAAVVLDGLPALGLVYAGYRLVGTGLSPADRWRVWVWCLAGASLFAVVMGLSILVRAFEGRVIGEAVFPLLIATEAGGIAGVIAGYQTARARTETRHAQTKSDALRERKRRLQGVLDSVGASIWIRDTDGRFLLMNRRARTLFGIDEKTEAVGRRLKEILPPGVAEQFRKNDQRVLKTEEPIEIEETIETQKEEKTVLTRMSPLFEGDEVYAVCGVASDITEQKEYERKIERQNERLEQFAGVVSHDLRSPLSVASGRVELAQEDCDSEHLDQADRALDRMDGLIEDVLSLARAGNTATDLKQVDLVELANYCWGNVETDGATFVINTDRTVYADERRLKRVFENLFRNAVEHGGDVTVTVGELDDGFYVKDDGPGVPEDERDDVFDTGHSANEDGTGLGLSIVEQVVDAHGWDIRITEGSEGGARFEVSGVEALETA